MISWIKYTSMQRMIQRIETTKMNSDVIIKFLLFGIVVIAGFFKIVQLSHSPPMDIDEYGIYYNAYSISQTGKDEWGSSFPLFFKSFGDYKLPIDIYFSALLFKLFEPNIFFLRLPAVFFSLFYIPLTYLVATAVTSRRSLGLLGAAIVSILPHYLYFSQIISGSITGSVLLFASHVFFILHIKYRKASYFAGSSISLALSLYAYPHSWILVPILAFGYAGTLIAKRQFSTLLYLVFPLIASIPILLQFFIGGSAVRLSNTSAFSIERGHFIEIMDQREAGKNDILTQIFYNKGTTAAYVFLENYLKHFNLTYLVLQRHEPSVQSPPASPLYLSLLPLYVLGILYSVKKIKNPIFAIILFYAVISPLPSAITDGAVNAKRYLASLGIEALFISIGMLVLLQAQKKLWIIVLSGFLILEVLLFFKYYFVTFSQQGKESFMIKPRLIEAVAREFWPERRLIYTVRDLGEPQIYPLVGADYDPQNYLTSREIDNRDGWVYIKPFDGLYYTESMDDINEHLTSNQNESFMGVFSVEELPQLTKDICFDEIIDDRYPTQSTFKVIKIEPCK